MNAPTGSPAQAAGELYFRTDITPETLFLQIGRLRREARDEIDRLIRFLDSTDDHMEREPDDDEPSLGFQEAFSGMGRGGGGDDREPDLGSFDRMMNQEHCNRQRLEEIPEVDAEQDDADLEPSLGGLDHYHTQERWAAGGRRDLELDPAESGLGDHEGLYEQAGTNDWQQGSMGLMKTITRRLGLQIMAGAAAAPAAATAAPLANPDADLIELGRRFLDVARLRDAASAETLRLYEMGADDAEAEEAFEAAMDQMRSIFARMTSMRPTTIEGMRSIATMVLNFEWDGNNVEFASGFSRVTSKARRSPC